MQSQKRGVLTSKSGSATDQRQPSITISHNPIPITTSTTPPKKINPTPLPNANLISSLYANQPTLPQP